MRRGLLLALPLVCICVALPSALAASALQVPAMSQDAKSSEQWGLQSINAPAAWGLSTGAGVTVAVIDTGVAGYHEDLLGHIVAGGWGLDDTTDDQWGHGTWVAGVIAATKDNGVGVAGLAPDASILPIRAFRDTESVSSVDLLRAMDRAGDSGARVVNMSLSATPLQSDVQYVTAQMEAMLAEHPGTLYVAAAGNGPIVGSNNDQNPVFPCNTDAPNLICVGAYQRNPISGEEGLWYDSNYGATTVDLFAPGTGIWTTSIDGSYDAPTGTSMATPFVSGEAALLFSRVPSLTPAEAISLILSTTRPNWTFAGKSVSGGGPDAGAALAQASIDSDRDSVPDVVDGCPAQAYPTSTGCPNPTPTPTPIPTPFATVRPTPTPTPTPKLEPVPKVRTMSAKVTRCKQGKTCKNATVRLTPDRAAKVSLRIEVKSCDKRGRHCKWKRYTTKAFTASTRGASIVIRGKSAKNGLPKGTYRAIAVPSSNRGAGKPVTRSFRVR